MRAGPKHSLREVYEAFLVPASESTLSVLASWPQARPAGGIEEFSESDSEDVGVCWLVVEQPLRGNAEELR